MRKYKKLLVAVALTVAFFTLFYVGYNAYYKYGKINAIKAFLTI